MNGKPIDKVQRQSCPQRSCKECASHHIFSVHSSNKTQEKKVGQIIEVKRLPDLTSLLHVTALVIKFAKRFKNQAQNKKSTEKEETRLIASDIKEAEHL